jgi:transposase
MDGPLTASSSWVSLRGGPFQVKSGWSPAAVVAPWSLCEAVGHGNPYLARVLGEARWPPGRTNTFLGERYRRIARYPGAKRAIVAVGRSILIIIWHLLADPEARFHDPGSAFHQTRTDTERRKRNHVRQLEALGHRVTLQPVA